jgi:hypothetical protein
MWVMEQSWASRELPVLKVLVAYFDDLDRTQISPGQIADLAGLPENDVLRSLRALYEADPRFIDGPIAQEIPYPLAVTGVSERARRAVGQWPNGEQLAEELIRKLETAAEQEPDPSRKSKLRQAAQVLAGTARDVFVEVAGVVIARTMGA